MRYVLILIVTLVTASVAASAALAADSAKAALAATAGQGEKRFEPMGIGGGGGMFSPTGSPHDPKLCFVSCDMGGFYVSEDGGENWWMVDGFEMRGSTSCRPGFHPTDPKVVYMPCRSGEFRMSDNRGRNWKTLCKDAGWGGEPVNAIITDRGGDGKVILVCTASGLHRSADGGRTFSKSPGVEGAVSWAHFDQTSPADARRVIAGTSDGVCVSTDGGRTWTRKGSGIEGKLSDFCAGSDAKTGKVTCYAVTDRAVFVSADGGATFRKVAEAPDGSYQFACMAETHPDVCYVTTTRGWGVYKTTDGGRSWRNVFRFTGREKNVRWGWLATDLTPGWGGSAIGFGVNPAHPDHAMFTNTGELFVTRNGGTTWDQAMSRHPGKGEPAPGEPWGCIGLEVTTVWGYYFDPHDRNRTYVCYTDIGFIRSTDRGKSWYMAVKGSPWQNTFYNLQMDPVRKGVLYAAAATHHDIPGWTNVTGPKGQGGGVVMSTDYGQTWQVISNGLPTRSIPCTCVTLDPDSSPEKRTLYAVMHGDGVYKSTDGGRSWSKKSQGLGRPGNTNVYVVRIGPDKNLYALVTGNRRDMDFDVPGGLWKSTDGGESWTELTRGVNLWWPMEFAVHPKDPNRIWVSTSDVPRKSGGGLFVTTDGGKTWKHQLTQKDFDQNVLSYCHVFAIAFHPKDPEVMYLSVWTHGLFRSEDGGKTWKRIEGIPSETGVNRVTFDPANPETIYVTTFGKGVWKGPAKGY